MKAQNYCYICFIFCTLFLLFSVQPSLSQTFEGVIHYKIYFDYKKRVNHLSFWEESQANAMDYYTHGCSNRTTYRYNDKELWSEIYDCNSQRTYYDFYDASQVLWHNREDTELLSLLGFKHEKDVMEVLGFPCDRVILEYEGIKKSDKIKMEYFLSQQHKISRSTIALGSSPSSKLKEIATHIPLAIVSENEIYMKVVEATKLVLNDSLPDELFQISNKTLVRNGAFLPTPPQPDKGYEWWYRKLTSSMKYPSA